MTLRSRPVEELILFIAAAVLFSGGQLLGAEAPAVGYALPSAAAPGQAIDITFHGSGLGTVSSLWTSFRAEAKLLPPASADRATYRIAVADDVPVGIGAVRLIGADGVSSLHLIMIDDLPSIAESGGNGRPRSAQAVTLPVAVDGACDELGFDYYTFQAKRGQRVSIDVPARRLGSRLDPVVRLLDSAGRELRYCDDDPAVGPDCRFTHTFEADGQYVLEIRDINYEGGPQHRYRLRIGDFPLVAAAFPTGGKRGAEAQFALLGAAVDGVGPVQAHLPEEGAGAWLNARYASGHGSGFVWVRAGDLDELREEEPNDDMESAMAVAIPSAICGRLERAKDRDYYQFEAAKGRRLSFRAQTRSIGSPCDVLMQVIRSDGTKLAESSVNGADEGGISFSPPEDGLYCLRVEEINQGGGAELVYRIEMEPERPGFSLSVEVEKIDVAPGGEVEIKVSCVRRDFKGPIALSLTGAAAGFELGNEIIKEGKNETELKVKAPSDAAAEGAHFTIVGRATIEGSERTATASTAPAMGKLFPHMLHPPREFDGLIGLGLRAKAGSGKAESGEGVGEESN